MSKKYEITDITHPDKPHLRRIRALRDIPNAGVKTGDLGGWVEGEHNLGHEGEAWVSGEALVRDKARVSGRALVFGRAQVYGSARVYDWAQVSGRAQVYGSAQVYGNAWVHGEALVFGSARVSGGAQVSGRARVSDSAWVADSAIVQSSEDMIYARVIASEQYAATLHRTTDGHLLKVGCWSGTVGEFRTMIESDEWVEATPDQIELRRPELLAFTAMCEARIATWEQP